VSSVRLLPFDPANLPVRYGLESPRISRGRAVASEPGVEDRETGSAVTTGWATLMFQQSTTAVQDWCFNSRGGSDPGPNKMSMRASVSPPFMRLPHASASVLVSAVVVALSASEILENSESEVEISVHVDPWLGRRRSMVNGMSTANGGLVRELKGQDSGMLSSSSVPRGMSHLRVCD